MIDKNRINKPLLFNEQSMKDLKKSTPCGMFIKNDKVELKEAKTLSGFNQELILEGIYIFDSYDSYDNTAYVYSDNYKITCKVLYSDLIYIEKKEKKNG